LKSEKAAGIFCWSTGANQMLEAEGSTINFFQLTYIKLFLACFIVQYLKTESKSI